MEAMPRNNSPVPRLALLGALAALGSMAIQMVVPSLPQVARALGAPADDAQLVVSVYLAGLAIGQLGWAPIIDSRGRRVALIASLLLFLVSTAACAVAPTMPILLACRAAQAVGAAGTLVACRTMASDGAEPGRRAGSLALMSSITLISPAVAPSIGGLVAAGFGWRGVFWLLLAATMLLTLLAWRNLPETLGRAAHEPRPALLPGYRKLLRMGPFLRLTGANALMTASFYVFLGVTPFLLARRGLSVDEAGFVFSSVALGLVAGTLLVPVVSRRAPGRVRGVGKAILSAGIVVMGVVAFAFSDPLALAGGMIVLGIGGGMTAPALLADAIDLSPQNAGLASSLFGALQMLASAIVASLLAQLHLTTGQTALTIAVMVLLSLMLRSAKR